jgi:carbamoyl-phosphate synthase large subunit
MSRRLLVTGAGTGATENLVRSLRAGEYGPVLIGCGSDRFILAKASTGRRYLVPPSTEPGFVAALERLCQREAIELVIPTSDDDVRALSDHRELFAGRVFLPARHVIDLCQDKLELTDLLRKRGIAAPATEPVADLRNLDAIFAGLASAGPVWCRVRTGTRSLGAAPMRTVAQARAWIHYWEDMRGVPANAFTLSEYLPGRDFLCMSVWRDGMQILARTFERLAYFGGENSPSGVSSLSSLAKTVRDERVLEASTAAIRALDGEASGAFSVDLKEDRHGAPAITEINAGRFFIGMTAFESVAKHNMPEVFVRVALGEPVVVGEAYDAVEDYYLVRDLDTLPGLLHAGELFEGIEEIPDA